VRASNRAEHDAAMAETAHADQRPPVWTGHLVLTGRDPHRSRDFYAGLGLRHVATMDAFTIFELRGGTHLVVRRDGDAAGGPAPFDFMVEDLDATRERWGTLGVPMGDVERDDLGIHRTFTITDPDGNVITVNDSHVEGIV
jgi:catechol 2,3-dioxygenase-like lactoylglutathione lyase family enzyme